jgi:hypothetical protein
VRGVTRSWFVSRPRKALAGIVIGLLKTVEQERVGFQILVVRCVCVFRISATSTILLRQLCVDRSNLRMLTYGEHEEVGRQVSCFMRF